MTITSMTITDHEGSVEIRRTDRGAEAFMQVSLETLDEGLVEAPALIAWIDRDNPSRDDRYAAAAMVASQIYGQDKRGRVRATNSMVHAVLTEMERIAGC
jgi:hypothetical protein